MNSQRQPHVVAFIFSNALVLSLCKLEYINMHLKYLHLSVRKQQEIGTNLNNTLFYFTCNPIASDGGLN